MSAQKVASAVGLAALTALLLGIGLPAILPPEPVAEIVVPTRDDGEPGPTGTPEVVPPGRPDDNGDDNGDDDGDDDDSPDDSPENGQDDSPDDSPDDSAGSP